MPGELDLTAANTAALADIQAANAVPDTPAPPAAPAVEAAPAPVEAAPAAETPAPSEPAAPVAADTETPPPAPEDSRPVQEWTFTRKGQQVRITDPEQASALIRQGYDYTQKTMELAEAKRALEKQVQDILSNRELLRQQLAYIERQQGPVVTTAPPQPPQGPSPEDLVDVQTAHQLIQAQVAQARQQMAQESQQLVSNAILTAETERYKQEYTAEVNKVLATLIDEKYPLLKDVDKIDKLILDDVAEQVAVRIQMEPEKVVSIDDVKSLLAQTAQKRHAKLEARYKEHLKMEAVRAAKVTKQGIEPAGGAAPPPATTQTFKLGDPRLTEAAIADVNAIISRK